jgi:hypothetical protein
MFCPEARSRSKQNRTDDFFMSTVIVPRHLVGICVRLCANYLMQFRADKMQSNPVVRCVPANHRFLGDEAMKTRLAQWLALSSWAAASMKVFGDTVHFIALLSTGDRWHARAVAIGRQHLGPLVTTEWILTEVGDAFSPPRMSGWGVISHWQFPVANSSRAHNWHYGPC